MAIPGFNAEAACYVSRNSYSHSGYDGFTNTVGVIIPQLPREIFYRRCDRYGECSWVTETVEVPDPGGWEVPDWIGDVRERQCRANCRRIRDPKQRLDCLDEC